MSKHRREHHAHLDSKQGLTARRLTRSQSAVAKSESPGRCTLLALDLLWIKHIYVSEHHLSPDCVAHVDGLIEGVARGMAEQAAARLQPVRSESRRFPTADVARAYTHSPIRHDLEYPALSHTPTRSYGKY